MVAPCATPEVSTRRLLTGGHRPRSEKFAKFLNEKKGEADHQDLIHNRSSSIIINPRQLERKDLYEERMKIPDVAFEARESNNANELEDRNGNEEQALVRRSTICAQDYYPTSFKQSSTTFSPVKLRKMHLSPKPNKPRHSTRSFDQDQMEHNASKRNIGENQNKQQIRHSRKNEKGNFVNPKTIRSMVNIEGPSIMSMPQMKELMNKIEIEHRKTVLKQTSISAEIAKKETKAAAEKFDLSSRMFHENKFEIFGATRKSKPPSEAEQRNLDSSPTKQSFYRKKTLKVQKLSSRKTLKKFPSSTGALEIGSSTSKQGHRQEVAQYNSMQSFKSRTHGKTQKLCSQIRSIPAYAKHRSANSLWNRQNSLLPARVSEISGQVKSLSPNNSRVCHSPTDEVRSSVRRIRTQTMSTKPLTTQLDQSDSKADIGVGASFKPSTIQEKHALTDDIVNEESIEQVSIVAEELSVKESGVAHFDSIMSFFTSLNSTRQISEQQTSFVGREDENVMDVPGVSLLEEVDAEDANSLLDEPVFDAYESNSDNMESIRLKQLLEDSKKKEAVIEDENVTEPPAINEVDTYEVLGINTNASDEDSVPEQNNDVRFDLSDDLTRPEAAREIIDIVRKASIRSILDQSDSLERKMKQKEDMNRVLVGEEKISTKGNGDTHKINNERIDELNAENKKTDDKQISDPKSNDLVMDSKDLLSGLRSDDYSSFSQSQYSSGSIFEDDSQSVSNAGLSCVSQTKMEEGEH
uniref:Uncharacterized protein n=1 Tax=Chaetoceros debilis TaxID=122233 RepID=A0A7S3PUQ4_9STRA